MLSIVDREPLENVVSIGEARPADESAELAEFEIVLGRRQIASVLFVATIVFGAFSSLAYLAGKSVTPKPVAAAAPAPVPAPAPVAELVKTPEPAATPARPAIAQPEAPLFGDPKSGAMYLQLGAVEKGVAIIMAEGLRKRGLSSFVAPGPNEHIFRVLIGPLDAEGYKRTKDAVDAIGLSTFARKYQQ